MVLWFMLEGCYEFVFGDMMNTMKGIDTIPYTHTHTPHAQINDYANAMCLEYVNT